MSTYRRPYTREHKDLNVSGEVYCGVVIFTVADRLKTSFDSKHIIEPTAMDATCSRHPPGLQEVIVIEDDEDYETYDKQHNVDFIIELEEEARLFAEAKFMYLKDLFPLADSTFLRAKCADVAEKSLDLVVLVDDFLQNGYPKEGGQSSVSTSSGLDSDDVYENWVSNIRMEEYMKKYPDPIKYFSECSRSDKCLSHSLNFLLLRHKLINATVIKNKMKANKYSLFLTHLDLLKVKAGRKTPRNLKEVHVFPHMLPPDDWRDEAFLVLNYEEITRYCQDKEEARKAAIEEARKAQALLICGCCFDDEVLDTEVLTCSEGHIFCKSCVRRGCEIAMGEGKLDFPCLQGCPGFFETSGLKDLISDTLYDKLEKKLAERSILAANIPGLETCSFCEYAAIPPPESHVFECDNCNKHMCRLCRKETHIPLKCSEVSEQDKLTKDRLTVEERMTEALLRTCRNCGTKFIRIDGCNKMTCVCGAKMCYICRKPVKSYDHFYDKRPDENKKNQCPLYTNNEVLHRREVNEEARRAIGDLKRSNPDLDYLLYKKKKR